MGKKWPTNENIHIGDIFKETFRDECGSDCALYQVVGKRAKTLVELRPIREERFVDEDCNLGLGQVRVRPLPGQFLEDAEIMTVGVCVPSGIDGRNWLHGRGEDGWRCFSEMRNGETTHISGYAGFYAIDELKKEGKLPVKPEQESDAPSNGPAAVPAPDDWNRTATREEMKAEALVRMDLLGLYEQTIQRFQTEGEIGLTEQSGMDTSLKTSHYIFETLDQAIQRFEEEYNCVVYHAIQYWGLTSWPSLLLFVSPAIREWAYERECIRKSMRVCAFVTGSANGGIREIIVKPQDGCLAWVE